MIFCRKAIILLIFTLLINVGVLNAIFIKPSNNLEFNYTHILFEWKQIANANAYNLVIDNLTIDEDNIENYCRKTIT